jgi:hypothetical protein
VKPVCEARRAQPVRAVEQSPQEREIARTYPLLAGSGSLYGDCVRGDASEVYQSGTAPQLERLEVAGGSSPAGSGQFDPGASR